MATSGIKILNTTGIEVVTGAFELIGVKSQEQPLQAAERADGFRALNEMVKGWQAQGFHLWTNTEGVLFLVKGKVRYDLGPGGDEATTFDDFIQTTLTVAAIATATTITVGSTTGMVALDNIGIELDDGTRQWTTIVSVDSPTGLTITDPLTAAAAIGLTVYTFTDFIDRPVRIHPLSRRVLNDTEIQVMDISRSEYFGQTLKNQEGTITQFYYDPQLVNGRLYVWQAPSEVKTYLSFTFDRPIQIFDSNADMPDFPSEWFETIKYNLATRLGVEYSSPKTVPIAQLADQFLTIQLGFDDQLTSTKFVMGRRHV